MKMITGVILALLFGVVSPFACAQQTRGSVHTSVNADDDSWTMIQRDDDHELRIRIKGKAEFNDEYNDHETLSPGGSLRVEETRGSVNRRYEIDSDSGGNL